MIKLIKNGELMKNFWNLPDIKRKLIKKIIYNDFKLIISNIDLNINLIQLNYDWRKQFNVSKD